MSLSGGGFPASIVPAQKRMTLSTNFLSFNGESTGSGQNMNNFAQQYLPELYEQEVERYGNRTLSGFLRMVGAEMPMTSDQVIWSEQNRLHVAYKGLADAIGAPTSDVYTIEPSLTNTEASEIAIRVGQTVLLSAPPTTSLRGRGLSVSIHVGTRKMVNYA